MLRITGAMVTCRHALHSWWASGIPRELPEGTHLFRSFTRGPVQNHACRELHGHDAPVDVYMVHTSNRGSKSGMQPWMIGNMHGACAKKQAPLQAADDPRSRRNHAACRRSWLMAPGRCLAEAAAAGLSGCEWPDGHLGAV